MFSIRDMNGHWKSRVMWKGGGSSTTTTSSGIDPAFKPELKKALGAATKHTFGPEGDIRTADTVADTGLGKQIASDAVLGRVILMREQQLIDNYVIYKANNKLVVD